jgi:hypothetical protein
LREARFDVGFCLALIDHPILKTTLFANDLERLSESRAFVLASVQSSQRPPVFNMPSKARVVERPHKTSPQQGYNRVG